YFKNLTGIGGTAFWVFHNIVVLPVHLLQTVGSHSEESRLARMQLIEGILGLWFGNALEVPYNRLSESYWLVLGLRKYYVFRLHGELFGRIDATVLLKKILDVYCSGVEYGLEKHPLASAGPAGGFLLDADFMYHLKSFLIIPTLECL